jgi:monoamine oxidase
MTTRREFIKQTSKVAAGAFVAPNLYKINLIQKPKVLILGAGLAGLAAGLMLKKNGYEVSILEARNRIGGRVYSHVIDEADKLVIELGGEWIGESHERMIALCDEFNLELFDNRFNTHLVYDNRYFKDHEWNFSPEWKLKYEKIIADYANYTLDDKKKLDKMDWWRFLMNHDISQKDLDLTEYIDSTDFGESIRFVSAYAALAEYAESSEFNEMDYKIKGGNDLLPRRMADSIGSDKIFINHKITDVTKTISGFTVTCSNGNRFYADKIVCSLPTFAISKINWNPSLPGDKIDAINALQYCRINKSATLFNKRFWENENFDMVTDQFAHYFYHATKFQRSDRGVLISYSVGDKADILSNHSLEGRKKIILDSLKVAFNVTDDFILKNLNYYWGDDEFTKGAYAFYGKDQWFNIMPVLKEPWEDIYFAGEHLADWQGFMEGAVNTGEEAAELIMG